MNRASFLRAGVAAALGPILAYLPVSETAAVVLEQTTTSRRLPDGTRVIDVVIRADTRHLERTFARMQSRLARSRPTVENRTLISFQAR